MDSYVSQRMCSKHTQERYTESDADESLAPWRAAREGPVTYRVTGQQGKAISGTGPVLE